jgi:hypothetical protein
MTQTGGADLPDLDARYGRTTRSRALNRVLGWGAGAAIVVVFVAWLAWGGALTGSSAQFEARDLGFEVVSDREVRVDWQFTVEPGIPAKCAVHALNSTYAIVGWEVVDLPASDALTRRFAETMLTTEQAVTGLIYRCWLA